MGKAPKQYSLTATEKAMLQAVQQANQIIMANYLASICVGRLAQEVTNTTRFEVSEDGNTLTVSDPGEAKAPEAPAGESETAKAMKK